MNRPRPHKTLILTSTIVASLNCFGSDLQSSSQASTRSPEERSEILEIATPRTESMIDVGGRRLHCFAYGNGSPTVVLVIGLESPQEYWNSVIPDLAATATVVTFDRAGIGKSEIGDLPTHGEQSAKDLRVLLEKMNAPTPYILVGHSYGGSVVRLFASTYPDHMAGLILEETQHEDVLSEMRNILQGEDLETFEQFLVARFEAPENPKTESDYRNVTREQIKKSKPPTPTARPMASRACAPPTAGTWF